MALHTKAQVLCVQEHGFGIDDVATIQQWLKRNGWKSVFAPAARSEAGKLHLGAAVLTRECLGLSVPEGGGEIYPGRCVGCLVQAPGYRDIFVYSAYFKVGKGWCQENFGIIEAVGLSIRKHGRSFILGADWNMTASCIKSAKVESNMAAKLVTPDESVGTCVAGKTVSTISHLLIGKDLAAGIKYVRTQMDAPVKTHRPTTVTFHKALVSKKMLVLRPPPRIKTEKPFGPSPEPKDWTGLKNRLGNASELAEKGFDEEAFEELSNAYKNWADLSEQSLCGIVGQTLPKYGLRGCMPVLVWKSVLPQQGFRREVPQHLEHRPEEWHIANKTLTL